MTHVLSRQLPLFLRPPRIELQIVIQEVVRSLAIKDLYPLPHPIAPLPPRRLSSLIVEEGVRSRDVDMLLEAGIRVRLK